MLQLTDGPPRPRTRTRSNGGGLRAVRIWRQMPVWRGGRAVWIEGSRLAGSVGARGGILGRWRCGHGRGDGVTGSVVVRIGSPG